MTLVAVLWASPGFAADPEGTSSPPVDPEAREDPALGVPLPSPEVSPDEETPEMRRLRNQIARDREAIKELISNPETDADVLGDPRLRELAERVAHQQEELEALRHEPSP